MIIKDKKWHDRHVQKRKRRQIKKCNQRLFVENYNKPKAVSRRRERISREMTEFLKSVPWWKKLWVRIKHKFA